MTNINLKYQDLILGTILLFTFIYPFLGLSQKNSKDVTTSFSSFLKSGEINFYSRTQVMSTLNEESGNDYFTLGTSGGIEYTTPLVYGFQIKAGGYLSFRLVEYNLVEAGEWTKSRYEKALYDIKNPSNKYNLGSLDELYLLYKHKSFSLKFGRQTYETPLLNKNYNRLRPNLFQGLSVKYQLKTLTFSGAWFISEGIRGTMDSYSMANTFGVYGQGRHTNGLKNDYHGHITSLGTGVFGLVYKERKFKTQIWNYIGENIFNTTFLQSDYAVVKNRTEFQFGIQGFYQTALNHGGNSNQDHTYMLKDEQTFAIGGKLGIKFIQQHELSLNYLGISDKGRFLFPREWGREQFYASQTTELFEGNGGVNAFVMRYKYNSKNNQHATTLSAGLIDQPSVDNLRINKYALDNYYHFLAEYNYSFSNYLKGLSLRFITTYKKEMNEGSMTATQKINKVDMIHLNLVVNYAF